MADAPTHSNEVRDMVQEIQILVKILEAKMIKPESL